MTSDGKNTTTYHTKYGDITLRTNEQYIGAAFEQGKYWESEVTAEPPALCTHRF
jgi:hypothetical protein